MLRSTKMTFMEVFWPVKDVPSNFFYLVFQKKKKNFVKYKCSIFSFFLEIHVFSHTDLLDF